MSIADTLIAPQPNPIRIARVDWWQGLFGTKLNIVLTILTALFILWIVPPFFGWAILDATWVGTAADCAAHTGACWAFIVEKARFISFGFYPPELQWRPALVIVVLLSLLVASALPRLWRPWLLLAWAVGLVGSWLLLAGTLTPPTVNSSQWGGFTVTVLVWVVCFGAAFPMAVLLALARQSRLGGVRTLAVVFIELMRGIPMVAILYAAMLLLPMAVPNGQLFDKLARAMVVIALFWSAYVAEVVRAGLQAIPPGQAEAAAALGLGYWRVMGLVVLPQALRLVIPGIVNQAIGFLLATSLLTVIGIFDLLNAARNSAVDPKWLGFYDEAYVAVAIVYFIFCHAGSRYSLWLEKRIAHKH